MDIVIGRLSERVIIKRLLEREKIDHATLNKLNELGIY